MLPRNWKITLSVEDSKYIMFWDWISVFTDDKPHKRQVQWTRERNNDMMVLELNDLMKIIFQEHPGAVWKFGFIWTIEYQQWYQTSLSSRSFCHRQMACDDYSGRVTAFLFETVYSKMIQNFVYIVSRCCLEIWNEMNGWLEWLSVSKPFFCI